MAIVALVLYAGGGAGAESPPVRYTVAPGDTLWEIAMTHYPVQEDPRPRIEAMREANGLSGSRIYPGMRLELPPAE